MVKVSPSILSADFSRLAEEIRRMETAGADMAHVDVMDGVFVPNITIGPAVISSLRPHTKMLFDVHLMIVRPERYLTQFCKAGADFLTVHVEASDQVRESLHGIHDLGAKAGVSLNPATPFEKVEPFLAEADLLLIMTVNPGFGGQSFMHEVVPKIRAAREYIDREGLAVEIEIDGGVNASTAPLCVQVGADILAAGSALFQAKDMSAEVRRWHEMNPVY
jgi:ribulose-phosphate 3-epimerase